jgi:glutathione synthase/RimK-type ligase-like ATP-grasp enzyme
MKYDVIVVTDCDHIRASDNPLIQTIQYEDGLVKQALTHLGLKAKIVSWDDPAVDWSETKSIVFRSTWDYFKRFEEFSVWLKSVSEKTILFNSKDTIYWNIDKHYLKDLANRGINIATTHFINKGEHINLKSLHEKLGWKETVLKPCVSGTARHTYRLNASNMDAHEILFQQLITEESMMLSPFQNDIVHTGERSLVLLNGVCTHAVLKVAKPGEFRVQESFGGSVQVHEPTQLEVKFAQMVVNACPELPIYARVDIFTDNNDELAVLEVELIEPELWFRNNPPAALILAKALKDKLNAH